MKFSRESLHFSLPLLGKELIEQAARPRTYIVRVLCAVLVLFFGMLMLSQLFAQSGSSAWSILGRGGDLFTMLTAMQFVGVYLLMPALVCGTITQEKERDSLMLLFLTRLGPWTILWEKLLSRLIPMATLLLLCLPLQSLAYSLGGVSPRMLWGSQWMLMVAAIQMATLALACSCVFRTTVGAFLATYIAGILVLFGPLFLAGVLALIANERGNPFDPLQPLMNLLKDYGLIEVEPQLLFPFFSAVQFFILIKTGMVGSMGSLLVASLPSLATAGLFLLVARMTLVTRAFVSPVNLLRETFRTIDRGIERFHPKGPARVRVNLRDTSDLPDERPIAWRETEKRSLGRTSHLVRILLLLMIPLCGLQLLGLAHSDEALAVVTICLTPFVWFLGILLVSVSAVSIVAGERTHQTLDVLCTLPLTGRDIVLQKFRGVSRLIFLIWVPLGWLASVEAFLRGANLAQNIWGGWPPEPMVLPYLLISILSALVYLPMVAWLCCLVGMLVRSQGRAIITALGVLLGWLALPFLVIILPLEVLFGGRVLNSLPFSWLPLLSPATLPTLNEANEVLGLYGFEYRALNTMGRYLLIWMVTLVNFGWYGFCWWALRQICLRNADRFLGRMEAGQRIGGMTQEAKEVPVGVTGWTTGQESPSSEPRPGGKGAAGAAGDPLELNTFLDGAE